MEDLLKGHKVSYYEVDEELKPENWVKIDKASFQLRNKSFPESKMISTTIGTA